MNVSERGIYMARELVATGREDLCQSVERGEITVLAALKIAKPEKYTRQQSRLEHLKRQWSAASLDEQVAFMDWILVTGGYSSYALYREGVT
jgi:hypothetical protein